MNALREDLAMCRREAPLYERAIWAVAAYRVGRWLAPRVEAQPGPLRLAMKMPLLAVQRLVEAFTGIELPTGATIGPGLRIWHGQGLVLNPKVRLGSHCVLRHGVTVGNLDPGGPVPVVGDRVEFGAYAQVLGGITVGDDARIGAMSVVLQDVPAGATAVGVPARIIAPSA